MRHFEIKSGITEGDAECQGVKLHYARIGTGDPIVFIHGTGLDCRMWVDQLTYFGKKYEAIAYDMRGFGLSSPLRGESYSPSDDLAALLDALGYEAAHLVGLSRGSLTALEFALAYPQRLRRLILEGAYINGLALSREYQEVKNEVEFVAQRCGVDHAKRIWINSCLFASSLAYPGVNERLRLMLEAYNPWHWLHPSTEMLIQPAAINRLEEIKAPTLIVLGKLDIPHFHNTAGILVSRLPAAKLVALADVGHLSPMENPLAFNTAVDEFLGSYSGGQQQ